MYVVAITVEGYLYWGAVAPEDYDRPNNRFLNLIDVDSIGTPLSNVWTRSVERKYLKSIRTFETREEMFKFMEIYKLME